MRETVVCGGVPVTAGEWNMAGGDTVELECTLFKRMPGGYFRRSEQTNEPVYVVSHGGMSFTLPFRGIRKEFGIVEGSHDDKMLIKIAEALDYVSALSPGDALPLEMVDRRASWEPAEQDRRYALALVRHGLVRWHRHPGAEEDVEPAILVLRMDEPSMRAAVEAAVAALASDPKAGLGDTGLVTRRMQELAKEIAYCECVFRRFREGFSMVTDKLRGMATTYKRDRMVSDQVARCLLLLDKARKDIDGRISETSANYGESYSIIVNFDRSIEFIRDARDRHYKTFRVWEDLFQQWSRLSAVEDRTVLSVIEATYRILAPRYAPIQEWVTFLSSGRTRKTSPEMIEW